MDNLPIQKKSNESNINSPNSATLNIQKKQRQKKIIFKQFNTEEKNEKRIDTPLSIHHNRQDSINSNQSKIISNTSIKEERGKMKPTSFTHITRNLFLTKSPKKKNINSPFRINKNIKNENEDEYILRRKTHHSNLSKKKKFDIGFSFLEQPEFINNKQSNTHIIFRKKKKISHLINNNEEDNNASIYSLTGLSRKKILELNDIQKDFKKSVIGLSKKDLNSLGKNYLDDEEEDEDNNNSNNISSDAISSEEENKIDKERYRMLQRVGKTFDSLDEEDIAINDFYISPDNKFIIILDIIIAIITIYNLIYIPLFLGLNDIYCRQVSFFNILTFFDIFTDIIYIIDNILPFFIALYTIDDALKTDLRVIRRNYLRSYFIIDFLAAIPFKTIFSIFDKKCNDEGYLSAPLYQKNIYYLLIVIQLPKAIKVFNRNWLIDHIKKYLNQYEHFNIYLGLYENILIFFVGLHIVACTFIFVGKNEYPGWIINFGFQNKTFWGLYFIAIYYIITTVTTVGYGDLTCVTPIEKLFGLFMEIVGIFAYSFALTSISNYVKVLSDKNEEFHQKCEILDDIRVNYPELSDDLYIRIHRYLKSNLFNDKKDKKLIINSLPITLKNTLICHMYEPIIKNFVFFKNFNNVDFVVRVILCFRPILAVRNDILIKDGDFVEDIIFVKFGRLSLDLPILFEKEEIKTNLKESNTIREDLTLKNNFLENLMAGEEIEEEDEEKNDKNEEDNVQYFKILDIQKNEHFGDILMFLNKRSSLRLKVKTRKAELFYLNKNDALEISTSFPQIWKKINKRSLFNWQQIKRLMNKIYKIFNKFNNNENEEDQQNFITTSFLEYTELESISSLNEASVEDDEKTQKRNEKKLLKENTLKNKELLKKQNSNESGLSILKKNTGKKKNLAPLKTIKESKSFEDKEEEYSIKKQDKMLDKNSDNHTNTNLTVKSEKTEKSMITQKMSINDEDYEDNDDKNYSNSKIDETLRKKKIYISENVSEEAVNKNYISPKSNSTPYKPNEINNEIYPYETFIATTANNTIQMNSNIQSFIKSKVHIDNNSICSTEISFSIESEYENINEISNFKYSKNLKLQRQVRNIFNDNNYNDNNTFQKSNLRNINKGPIKKTSSVKFIENEYKKNTSINSYGNISVNSNISKNNVNHCNSFLSKKSKSNLSYQSNQSGTSNQSSNSQTEIPKRKKKKSLLNVIHQNMERNYMDLNDPNLFYSEFFQHYFEKKHKNENEHLFADLDEELIKKFETLNEKDDKKSSPLKKFINMLKKI